MWVTVASPEQQPQSLQLGEGRLVLGRSPSCDVVIEDPHVSHKHAQLDITATGAWLADLQSTNGTFVDGVKLRQPAWIPLPSEFRVGETEVRLTADEPTRALTVLASAAPPSAPPTTEGPPPAPAVSPTTGDLPPPPPAPFDVRDAGPVAGGGVVIRGGRDAAGRDLIIHEGFKLRTKMRASAKNCIRLGCVMFLIGFAIFGYFVITWNNQIFDAVSNPSAEPPTDLPSPLPWLPLGAGLAFFGLALVVIGLLIPRDRIVTRSDE